MIHKKHSQLGNKTEECQSTSLYNCEKFGVHIMVVFK